MNRTAATDGAEVAAEVAAAVVITNIGELVTNDPAAVDGAGADLPGADLPGADLPGADLLGICRGAALVIEDGHIAWVGPNEAAPAADTVIDAGGGAVIPGFVDSHSHLVFAGDRAAEFAARMSGQPYTAGGIRFTVAATRAATDEELAANLARHVRSLHRQGTTTIEIKSGYGLSVHDEVRSLQVASRFTTETTFLGAHVVPAEYAEDPGAYVDLVSGPMLAAAASYARWIDVFCETGAFDVDQARQILRAGAEAGLRGRLHANQLGHGPGVMLAAELGLTAVDHCTWLTDADVHALRESGTVATLLPGVEFSTRQPYPSARRLIDAGVNVALASDCNPGSSYTSSMGFCIAVAVREMGMTPSEAVWSATAGGAAALGRTDIGRLAVGSPADLVILDAPSHLYLAYRPGVPLVARTLIGGVDVRDRN